MSQRSIYRSIAELNRSKAGSGVSCARVSNAIALIAVIIITSGGAG
ncbi:MAG: hypothetical protein JSS21_00100 [Proteobacteria bacterium]|nr:hypothetical protein [Pseudomonadota bacterium]